MELRTSPIPRYSWISRSYSLGLVVLFTAALALPALGWFLGWQGAVLNENRNLAPPPDFRHTRLTDLPTRIESYYEDHIGFRGSIIRASGVVLYRWLGQSSADVVVGKTPAPGEPPWYFFASEGVLDDRLGLGLLTQERLETWRESLESRARWLQRRGIAYLFVIMPEKSSIYPEFLPDYLKNHLGPTRLEQLGKYLKDARSPVAFLDMSYALRQAKPEGALFFPLDTHWNGRAAFYVYQAIIAALKPAFPDLAPGVMNRDFEIREGPRSLRIDLASMLGLSFDAPTPLLSYIGDAKPQLAAAPWPAGLDPAFNLQQAYGAGVPGLYALAMPGRTRRLLVFHDSAFVANLLSRESQPLAMNFAHSYFAWMVPSDAALQRFAEMEQPDLVIEEHGERFLRFVPPPPAPFDVLTPQLRRSQATPAFLVEKINGGRVRPDLGIPQQGELRIEGWAFDGSVGRPARGVEIVIDGVPQPAGYGMEHEAPAGCGDCRNTGFLADYPLTNLSPGPHILGIRVITADGASYSEAIWGRVLVKN